MKTTHVLRASVRTGFALLALFAMAGIGCGASEADTLFDAPSGSVTPDTLYGLWGGKLVDDSGVSNRIRFAPDSMSFATRCTKGDVVLTAFVQVKARVTSDKYEILEDKSDSESSGRAACTAAARVGTLGKCVPDTFGGPSKCFEVKGTTLTLYGISQLDKYVFTKLSD